MKKYIVFNHSQIEQGNGRWKYESQTKFRITCEDDTYYYILNDRFEKINEGKDYKTGEIVSDIKKD